MTCPLRKDAAMPIACSAIQAQGRNDT
jgi:hypothetical protein